MAITSLTAQRSDGATTVTAVSNLSPGAGESIRYHWYLDGVYVGVTFAGVRTFALEHGDQGRLEVLDTLDPDFDPVANAPEAWPARRRLWWVRSTAADVDHYRVEQQADGGAWSLLGIVRHEASAWDYEYLTPRLDDLTEYAWRVVPVDAAGNEGTALSLGSEDLVRTPDAPDFTATFNAGPTTVTIAAA